LTKIFKVLLSLLEVKKLRGWKEEGEEKEREEKRKVPLIYKLIILGIGVFVIIGILIASVGSVEVGYAAVLIDPVARTISGPIIGPTFYIKAPWVTSIHIYYAMDSVSMWTEYKLEQGEWVETARGDFPAVVCLSKDGLQMEVDVLVRWSLDPTKLVDLYKEFPDQKWKEKAITSIIREIIRNTIAKYSATEVIERREVITADAKQALKKALLEEVSLHDAIVESTLDVDIRDIDPPQEFLNAIQAKLSAQQAMIAAEYEKQKIITIANATAMQEIIKAQGEAQSRIIVAQATQESIKRIAESAGLTNSTQIAQLYLTLEALKEIAKTGRPIFLMIGGQTPIMIPITPESIEGGK
jgi:regulator of protease activity HflC (stomatin/prohibitin superfamily)